MLFYIVGNSYEVKMVDELVRGMISTPMETLDNFITDEITNHLFEDSQIPFSGLDLAALNIQRARDHGLRPYNEYRAICNLKRARTFEDFSREIKPELIEKLSRVSFSQHFRCTDTFCVIYFANSYLLKKNIEEITVSYILSEY